jgi:hypothetical protein
MEGGMRRALILLAVLSLAVSSAHGDGIILADGRKLSGRVVEKPDGYEVTVEGQTVGFSKAEVKQWFKSPKEVLGDADKLVEDAKKLYSEAVVMSDEKAAEAKFREALPKVQKAREAYVEARELFPEGYPELDAQLINVMKLMRLVRERFHSQLVDSPSPAPVKVKDAPAPRPSASSPNPLPTNPAEPTSDPAAKGPSPEPSSSIPMKEALEVLVDPAKRSDAALRARAKATLQKASDQRVPFADVATAGWLFLSKPDQEWGLRSDVVTAKGPAGAVSYKGQLDKRSDAISVLVLADHREIRIRTASEGTYLTPPGGSEFKTSDYRVSADEKSESFDTLQAYFKGIDASKFEALDEKDISEGVKFLALKVKELRSRNQPAEALTLFVAGSASALIEKNKGKPTPEIEAAFRDLGYEKSEFGSVWGRKEGLAMDDYRKWLATGEYGLAIVQFQNDYRSLNDVGVRCAMGLLMLFQALTENRNYQKAAAAFESASTTAVSPTARDHFLAFARSIREQAPCNVCGGTHKVNCSACKGKKKVNLECTKCGGSGKLNTFNGVKPCVGCNGQGRYNNVDCPKCKATGQTECKARGCVRPVPRPTFESFADAYPCPLCRGRGSLMRHVAYPCAECEGVGLLIAPKADPTKMIR